MKLRNETKEMKITIEKEMVCRNENKREKEIKKIPPDGVDVVE